MGKHTDPVPDMFGPYRRDFFDAYADHGVKRGLYEKLWLNEAGTISAAAWDNLGAGSPHWVGVDFAQAEDRTAIYLFGNRAGKSFTKRTRNPRMKLFEQIAVMQHFEKGGKVECRLRTPSDTWTPHPSPVWDWYSCEYRIKPEEPKKREIWIVEYRQSEAHETTYVGYGFTKDLAIKAMYQHRYTQPKGKQQVWRVVKFVPCPPTQEVFND